MDPPFRFSVSCMRFVPLHVPRYTQTQRQSHTQTCHSPSSSSTLMNQTIRHKVACKQRQLVQCVILSGWLISFRAVGMREGHIAIFRHWTAHWSHWDWLGFRWNGSFHTGEEGRRGEDEDVCVCVCVWVQMRQCFRNRKRVWKKELAEHRALISLWRYRVPGPNFGKPPRSNFQCLSQLIHHGVIAVSLLSRLWAADEPQLKASIRIPYL